MSKEIFIYRLLTKFYVLLTLLVVAIFMFIYWWNVSKDEEQYEKYINQSLVSYYDFTKESKGDTSVLKSRILRELDYQVGWEWKHEKFNRSISQFVGFLSYFLNLAILTVVILLLLNKEAEQGRLSISKERLKFLVFLSVFHLIVSTYIGREGFDMKQKAHDFRARELQTIRTGLEIEIISNQKAWDSFREIYTISPQESLIRKYGMSRYSQ